jgi:hypothetical protein
MTKPVKSPKTRTESERPGRFTNNKTFRKEIYPSPPDRRDSWSGVILVFGQTKVRGFSMLPSLTSVIHLGAPDFDARVT